MSLEDDAQLIIDKLRTSAMLKDQAEYKLEHAERVDGDASKIYYTMIEEMKNGKTIKGNPGLDYSFFHYGSELDGKDRRVQQFSEKFQGYGNQRILYNLSAFDDTDGLGNDIHAPRIVQSGRLNVKNSMSIEIPGRKICANIDPFLRLNKFRSSSPQDPILLNPFINHIAYNEDGIDLDELFSGDLFRIDFRGNRGRAPIGMAPRGYHDDPYCSLIVGDELVREYMLEEGIEVRN